MGPNWSLILIVALSAQIAVSQDRALAQANTSIAKVNTREADILSLDEAISRAIEASPRLQAAQAGVDAARGSERQARLLPNPELGFEAENFQGGGPYRGFDSAELSYGLSQPIELGGERSARRDAAVAERQAAELVSDAARLDLIRDVTAAYIGAAAAQRALAIAVELESIAKGVLDNVASRVRAAREPVLQQNRAEVAYTTSQIARQRAEGERNTAAEALARFWGDSTLSETLSDSDLFALPRPEPLEVYNRRLLETPDLERYRRLRRAREADLRFARAGIIPDPTISLGVKQFRDTDESAFMAGISLPLPIFNQNQGEIARTRAEVRRVEAERRQAEYDQAQQLTAAWTEWQSSWTEAKSLSDTILPQAERAFNLALEGYRTGRFSYLEVLDAQRTLFEARSEHVRALTRLHTSRAQVERLAGIHRIQQPTQVQP